MFNAAPTAYEGSVVDPCFVTKCVLSSSVIILLSKKELVALLCVIADM